MSPELQLGITLMALIFSAVLATISAWVVNRCGAAKGLNQTPNRKVIE